MMSPSATTANPESTEPPTRTVPGNFTFPVVSPTSFSIWCTWRTSTRPASIASSPSRSAKNRTLPSSSSTTFTFAPAARVCSASCGALTTLPVTSHPSRARPCGGETVARSAPFATRVILSWV